jgi:hypothetical protein
MRIPYLRGEQRFEDKSLGNNQSAFSVEKHRWTPPVLERSVFPAALLGGKHSTGTDPNSPPTRVCFAIAVTKKGCSAKRPTVCFTRAAALADDDTDKSPFDQPPRRKQGYRACLCPKRCFALPCNNQEAIVTVSQHQCFYLPPFRHKLPRNRWRYGSSRPYITKNVVLW